MNNPKTPFEDSKHLIRIALVFLGVLGLFLIARSFIVPKSFGKYGHYRADAITEIAARPVAFGGHEVCEACHSEVLDVKKTGKHANVACEACHGPQAAHAEDPGLKKPARPDTSILCVRCHEAHVAKPKAFPQVVSKDHAGGVACGTCHQPHRPKIGE